MAKVKVFASGEYPQGTIDKEKTKKIFDSVKEAPAIFIHSSHWENKKPVELGIFKDFEMNENGEVYADIALNDKGNEYHKDGIFNGVSVEINPSKDTLEKIALLPLGVEPAVDGAIVQFEKEHIVYNSKIEFEIKETKEDKKLIIDDLKKEIAALDITGKKDIFESIKTEFEDKPTPKTEEELRSEIKEELSFENTKNNLKETMKKKIIPCLQSVVEFAIDKAGEERKTIIEFSETEKISMFEKIKKDIEAMKDAVNFKSINEHKEFNEKEETGLSGQQLAKLMTKGEVK